MRPYLALAAAVATAAATLAAAVPATAATWTAPATISAPHTFILGLEAASTGNGTLVADWRFQDGVGNGATTGARGAALAPGAAAFGGERDAPGRDDRGSAVRQPLGRGADLQRASTRRRAATRLSVAFGSADGPSLGTARSVAVDDVAFVPRLAVGSDGTGLLAWIARASGARRVVKVALRSPGGRFGAPSIISGTGRANTITAAVGPQGQRRRRVRARRPPARALPHGERQLGPDPGPGRRRVRARTTSLAALITSGGRAMLADVHRQLSEGGDTGPLLVDAWVRPVGATRFGARPAPRAGRRRRRRATPALVPGDGRGAVLAWVGGDPGAPADPGRRRARACAYRSRAPTAASARAQPLSPAAQPVTGLGAAGNGSATVVSWVRIAPGSDVERPGVRRAAAGRRRVRRAGGGLARRARRRARRRASPGRPTTGRSCSGPRGPAARARACRSRRSRRSCGRRSASPDRAASAYARGRWTCSSASPRRACSNRRARSSCCCRAAATRCACSTSRSTLAGADAVRALHVNYGLRARRRTATRRTAARCASASASPLEVDRAAPARRRPGNLQAWARDVRYGAAARLAAAAAAGGAGRRRRTPRPTRPRRSSTGSRRRRAAARCSGMAGAIGPARAAAARGHARGDRGVVPRARAGVARGRHERDATVTRAGACAAASCRRCARSHPAAERNVVRTAELLRDEAEVLDEVVDDGARRPRPHRRRRTSRRCRRALARLVVRRLAEDATGGLLRPRARPRSTTSWRSATARSTWATARAPSSPAACCASSARRRLPARPT